MDKSLSSERCLQKGWPTQWRELEWKGGGGLHVSRVILNSFLHLIREGTRLEGMNQPQSSYHLFIYNSGQTPWMAYGLFIRLLQDLLEREREIPNTSSTFLL